MITGSINSQTEIQIRLPIRDVSGHEQEVEVILDTGFSGSLTLPPTLISNLNLPWDSQCDAILANGSIEQFDLYSATILWDGNTRRILVQSIDTTPLLGMELLVGYDLRVRVVIGGIVEIEAIP
jgi:clan AA aspartic protease